MRGGPLSPYNRDIDTLLNDLHMTPSQIGQHLSQVYHLSPVETTAKKISDRISYLKKNSLIRTPAVNAANNNMWAVPPALVYGPANPAGCTLTSLINFLAS
jgi:hypothetical protein